MKVYVWVTRVRLRSNVIEVLQSPMLLSARTLHYSIGVSVSSRPSYLLEVEIRFWIYLIELENESQNFVHTLS